MKILQGFRTILFNVLVAVSSWLGVNYGIELTEEHQSAVVTTVIAAANIGLRMLTKTPVGKKDKTNKK